MKTFAMLKGDKGRTANEQNDEKEREEKREKSGRREVPLDQRKETRKKESLSHDFYISLDLGRWATFVTRR